MKPILFSWLTEHVDVMDGQPTDEGPSAVFHRYFWKHQRHILLFASPAQTTQAEQMVHWLRGQHPDREIEAQGISLSEPDDLSEVKPQVEAILTEWGEVALDLLFRSGTSAQQMGWYICHQSLGLNSRLLQWQRLPKRQAPKLMVVETERDEVPHRILIRQQALDQPRDKTHLITPRMTEIYRRAYRAGQSDHARVLIIGASGTGKTHLARYLHQQSPRAERPFISFNCASLAGLPLSQHLFGTETSPGLFQLAEGGTLFLDDVDQLSQDLQQQLFQVIREGRLRQITAWPGVSTNVRLITAASQDLATLCAEGAFRWDLYYLLAVVELEIPTLYVRGIEEIRRLTDFFLHEKKGLFHRKTPLTLSGALRRRLETYPWPGNVRELENLIEHLYVFCEEEAQLADLPRRFQQEQVIASESWREVEAHHLSQIYQRYGRNKSRTCRALGYGSINTLKKKLREYGIEGEEAMDHANEEKASLEKEDSRSSRRSAG
jgi:DNA-binding NtrC family response regulator